MVPVAYSVGVAVATSDTVNHANGEAQAIYVGGAGNVTLVCPGGAVILFTAPPVGSIIPIRNVRVNATGTTATVMVALY